MNGDVFIPSTRNNAFVLKEKINKKYIQCCIFKVYMCGCKQCGKHGVYSDHSKGNETIDIYPFCRSLMFFSFTFDTKNTIYNGCTV
jgi:hypothetical protein